MSGVIGGTGTTAAAATDETTDLGNVLFAEFGLRYETDVEYTGTTCQMSLYTPFPEDEELVFNAISEDNKEIIENNDSVVKNQSLEAFPTHIRGKQSNRVTTRTTERLDPTTDFKLEQPMTLPSARLSVDETDVILRAQGEMLRVESGEMDSLTLKQTENGPEHVPGTAKMFPVLEVNNLGRLDVTAATIVGGDST